ncbi:MULTISPECIES: 2OG-Fe dioxygenase family protein [Paraburkholderia]|uniref:2OG-Fe dioxygenase family protein n=1 Tax=Paraburkholderia TaxID=1822464 RepID=UPI00265A5C5D|nr:MULTISPECIES: 2OG-Fe dioxygenase family protein [Paraburkholderia]
MEHAYQDESHAQSSDQANRAAREAENLCQFIARKDFCFLPAAKTERLLKAITGTTLESWERFQDSWNRLEPDLHMADGGTYRYRRHATFSALPSGRCAIRESHQPHYQSLDYNHLNGGVARDFAPIASDIAQGDVLTAILSFCCELFGRLAPFYGWHIEVHQFRIDASQATANPTPEGIHRDGVNFVFMMMVSRSNIVNGETKIYDRGRQPLSAYTLMAPLDAAIVNDERVMHGVTPIARLDDAQPAYRDVLVVTFCKK